MFPRFKIFLLSKLRSIMLNNSCQLSNVCICMSSQNYFKYYSQEIFNTHVLESPQLKKSLFCENKITSHMLDRNKLFVFICVPMKTLLKSAHGLFPSGPRWNSSECFKIGCRWSSDFHWDLALLYCLELVLVSASYQQSSPTLSSHQNLSTVHILK